MQTAQPKQESFDKAKLDELQRFTTEWEAFIKELSSEELRSKTFTSILINFGTFVGNSINQRILAETTNTWKEYLKAQQNQPKIVKGVK